MNREISEYIKRFIDLLDEDDLNEILKSMNNKGIKKRERFLPPNGFTKWESVPAKIRNENIIKNIKTESFFNMHRSFLAKRK